MQYFRNIFGKLLPVRSFSKPARLFLITILIDGIINSGWYLFFNFYILGLGYGKEYLGLINSISSVATLVFGLPLGILSDRIGRKRAMLIGLACFSLGSLLQVTVNNPISMLVAGFVAGTGYVLYVISQAPFMMEVSDSTNRALLFSLSSGLITLSGAVGSLVAGNLPEVFGQWMNVPADSATAIRMVLLLSVILGTTSMIPIFLLKENGKHIERRQEERTPTRLVLKRPLIWKLLIPNILIGIGAAILVPYMNLFFNEKFGTSTSMLGVLFSLSSLITGVSSLLGPMLAHRLKSKILTVVVTQGSSLLFLLLLGFVPVEWFAATSFLIRGALMNMSSPLFSAFSMEKAPDHEQGTVSSLMNMSWTFGWAVGPFVSGLVQKAYGFSPLYIATFCMYLLSTVLLWLFFGREDMAAVKAETTEMEALAS